MSWKLTLKDIDEYKSAFALCDKDHDGKLSAQEMGNIMRTLGKNFSNQELNSIIEEIETKGKGFIELDKFIELMAHNKINLNILKSEQIIFINLFKYIYR